MKSKSQVCFSKKQSCFYFEQIVSIVIFLLLCNSCLTDIHSNSSQRRSLDFKTVQEAGGGRNYEYEPGKELYPRYSYEGLPEDFVIKKTPALSLTYEDIELVEIKKDPFSPSYMSTYIVTIYLSEESVKRMRTFSGKHLKKRVAMEIEGKIIKIATIVDIIGDKLSVTFTDASLSEIENVFRKVTEKIKIKEK